ncbi:MAG: putative glycoside hydrolase [bacterium]|nr:putative glycoside hydrolase [bacterium]
MIRKLWLFIAIPLLLLAGLFLFLGQDRAIELALVQDAILPTETTVEDPNPNNDIGPQLPLANPPEVIKALYATSWSAGSSKKMAYFLDLIANTKANALVIDVKDYTGVVSYHTDIEKVKEYNASEQRILRPNALIKKLHDNGIYVIARISVFQDFQFAKMRPDLAVHSSSTGSVWQDRKGQTWMDASASEVWDYNIAIAQDALDRGFDEINFDYIRFPSDGDMNDIIYTHWDGRTPRAEVIRQFFEYLRYKLPTAKMSADFFGYTTLHNDDLGIGQIIENAMPYFDAIAPMIYPSHYVKGHLGFDKPAEHPYDVIKNSMDSAIAKTLAFAAKSTTTPVATLRPWLQDFDLGADYDAEKVRAQIKAWEDAAVGTPELMSGWMMWNASNIYTADGLRPEPATTSPETIQENDVSS